MYEQETVDDLIKWMRPRGTVGLRMSNRLEAAHRRERGDAAKLREALGKLRAELWNNTVIAGKRKFELYEIADAALAAPATSEKSSVVGDAAKLREALEEIFNLTNSLDENCGVDPVEIRDIARAALAEPAKNCDVGTVEEMAKRMDAYCASYRERIDGSWRCDNCPLCSIHRCELSWAQMPYNEGGDK